MLVNNFSAGIWGVILAIGRVLVLGPFVEQVIRVGGQRRRLPRRQRPAAPDLDLHRAGQGAVPQQRDQPRRPHPAGRRPRSTENGKSILFLLEANPGPGLGLLLAYTFFGKGIAKASAPGAAIIQFFGGIHEVYFPYVLMKPKLIVAMIARRHDRRGPSTHGLRRRSAGPRGTGLDLRGLRCRPRVGTSSVSPCRSPRRGDVSFLVAAFLLKIDKTEDDGDLDGGDLADGGHEGQEVLIASSLGRDGHQTDPLRSSSPATRAWAPRRWAPRCSARRSRPPGTPRSPSSTRRSRTSTTTTTSW